MNTQGTNPAALIYANAADARSLQHTCGRPPVPFSGATNGQSCTPKRMRLSIETYYCYFLLHAYDKGKYGYLRTTQAPCIFQWACKQEVRAAGTRSTWGVTPSGVVQFSFTR